MKQRQNHINLGSFPKKRNSEGRLICLNCGKLLKGRQEKYCGFECSNDWLCKHSHQWMRSKLIKKVDNTCNHCNTQFQKHYLILDHIKPIALGGEEFDENNLQILCKDCDKIKTRKDQVDITKQRRKEKILCNGQKQLETLKDNQH